MAWVSLVQRLFRKDYAVSQGDSIRIQVESFYFDSVGADSFHNALIQDSDMRASQINCAVSQGDLVRILAESSHCVSLSK